MSNDGRILLSQEEADRKADEKRRAIGIEFYNVNSGETRVATTVEHIAAFFNSSDEGPNAKNKQDMGWRLAPEDLIELEEIKEDPVIMDQIARGYQIPPEDVADYNVLKYMANKRFTTARRNAEAKGKNYESDYEKRVRELREQKERGEETPAETPKVDKPRTINRDSGDGQFVSDEEVRNDPDGTTTETVKPQAQKPVANKPEKADNSGKAK